MTTEGQIAPDTKDWTWVLDRPCPDCGFVAGDVSVHRLGALVRENAADWRALLGLPAVGTRPAPDVWSVLEYACHVRDVHRVFDERLRSMLAEDEPSFVNWDQDETAVAGRYGEQDAVTVARELDAAAATVATTYERVPDGAWGRRGLRSNGSEFTVDTLGRYHLHDLVHHVHDVRAAAARGTVAAYDASAAAYAAGSGALPERVADLLDRFATSLPAGARVLEIGSGPGRDALVLERSGLSVRRTDITPAFVEMLRAGGYDADVVDPLVDDLSDPGLPGTTYDGVWASACLLHVDRADLPTVLTRLAAVTRDDGMLHLSLKEGDGERWSTHGSVAAPRRFVFWREAPLRAALEDTGWTVLEVGGAQGLRDDHWIDVLARRTRTAP